MRDFESRDEFSGLAARRFVATMTCGDECRESNHLQMIRAACEDFVRSYI